MKLSKAAGRFNKMRCADAYDASETFLAQLDLFDDSKRDGTTVTRRVLEVAGDIDLPARRTVTFADRQWLCGSAHVDTFRGEIIRTRYVVQEAQALLSIKTPAQALSTGGTDAYGSRMWTKDMKELEVSSGVFSQYTIYFAPGEPVAVGSIVSVGGRLHRVKNVYESAAGLVAAEANELDAGALETGVSYFDRTAGFDPVTDAVVEAAAVTLNVLRMRFQDDYRYPNEGTPKLVEGDIKALVLKSAVAAANVNDQLALSDGRWRVISSEDEGAVWGLHLRHV